MASGGPTLPTGGSAGVPLSDRLGCGPLALGEAADILSQAASALQAVHARGTAHGRISPACILVGAGAAGRRRVLVRGLGGGGGAVTPEELPYLAPEQLERPDPAEPSADVWALGIVAYQCLSGILPTAGPGPEKVLEYIRERPIWPLVDTCPDMPEDVAARVDRMLARDPAGRLSDLGELARVLAAHASDPAVAPTITLEASVRGESDGDPGANATPLLPDREVPSPARAASAWDTGMVFGGRYRILRLVATGGMGAVYEVEHLETGHRRALKVMHPHILGDGAARDRFRREARMAARAESDRIVDVLDAGVDEGTDMPFLVMELLRGEELDRRLERVGRLSAAEAVGFLRDVAAGLESAHRASIVHRDIKPRNLFLCSSPDGPERVKILDFGIAKLIADGGASAGSTQALGTPMYMAPEQFQSEVQLTPRADIFALGMVAFDLLAGGPYWAAEARGGQVFAVVAKAMGGPREPATARARRRGVELPAAFDAWFARMTHLHPEKRPASAVAAVEELGAALGLSGAAGTARETEPDSLSPGLSQGPPAESGARGRRWIPAATAVLALSALTAGTALWSHSMSGTPGADEPPASPALLAPTAPPDGSRSGADPAEPSPPAQGAKGTAEPPQTPALPASPQGDKGPVGPAPGPAEAGGRRAPAGSSRAGSTPGSGRASADPSSVPAPTPGAPAPLTSAVPSAPAISAPPPATGDTPTAPPGTVSAPQAPAPPEHPLYGRE